MKYTGTKPEGESVIEEVVGLFNQCLHLQLLTMTLINVDVLHVLYNIM